MSDPTKFNFSTVFEPGAAHPDDDPYAMTDPADIPVYSQNQLDAALAEARNESAGSAIEAAAQNADAVANQTLAAIQLQFTRLGTFQDSVVTEIHGEAVELATPIGIILARSLLARVPKAVIEALFLDIFHQHSEVGSTPKITIRVHPAILPSISPRIESLKNNAAFSGEISVIPAENLGPTDCLVDWSEGGAARNLKQLEEEISASVKGYLGAIGGAETAAKPEPVPEQPAAAEPAPETASAPMIETTPEPVSVIDQIAAEAQQAAPVPDQGS